VYMEMPPPVAKRKYTPSEPRLMMDGSCVFVQVPVQVSGLEKDDTRVMKAMIKTSSLPAPTNGGWPMAVGSDNNLGGVSRVSSATFGEWDQKIGQPRDPLPNHGHEAAGVWG
jgi:hypothetical protein